MLGANPLPESENGTLVDTPSVNETLGLNSTQSEEFVCAFYNPEFIIISSLGSFYIPCVIMIFLYIRIFTVRTKGFILDTYYALGLVRFLAKYYYLQNF